MCNTKQNRKIQTNKDLDLDVARHVINVVCMFSQKKKKKKKKKKKNGIFPWPMRAWAISQTQTNFFNNLQWPKQTF